MTKDVTQSNPQSRRRFLAQLGALAATPSFLGWSDLGGFSPSRPRRFGKVPFAPFPHFSEVGTYGADTFQLGNQDLLVTAFQEGVRLVATGPDTRYGGAEKELGWALKKAPDPVFVMTQIPEGAWSDSNRSVAMNRALRFSLDRLQRGNVEALVVRNPDPEQIQDPDFRRFAADVKQNGTVQYIGVSGQSTGLEAVMEAVLEDDLIDMVVYAAYLAEFQTIPELLPRLSDSGTLLVATMPEEAALWNRMPGWEAEAARRDNEPWTTWEQEFTRRALGHAVNNTPADNALLNLRRPEDLEAMTGR